nr:PREDICTED: leucine-rich repeat receptor protein kinase EMS1-like [Daucus carota subsp. sativus]
MATPLSMIKLLVRLSFIFFLVPCLCCPAYQKQSLLHFKSSLLNSYNTSNSSSFGLESWDSISDCCKWTRVVCSSHSRDIIALHLDDLCMDGSKSSMNVRVLDPIYGIRSLRFLNISYTWVQGEISGEGLANLTKLIHLDMSQNLLNGSIPAQLFQLRFLQSLDLSDNSLKDGLSREIGKLEDLRSLKLDRNSIDGNIPVQIGNLTRLQQFSISHNKFLGRIPESILNLKELEKLDASNNYLEMHIPNRIGTLFHISILVLGVNRLTGSIPLSIRNLSKLETLRLEDNMLSGEIPSWLFDIDSLKNLYLGGNKHSGMDFHSKES